MLAFAFMNYLLGFYFEKFEKSISVLLVQMESLWKSAGLWFYDQEIHWLA